MRFRTAIANIKAEPCALSETTSQGLYGEQVDIVETEDEWSRITNRSDGYSGFVASELLSDDDAHSTHWVCVPSSPLFTGANIKGPVSELLPYSAELAINRVDGEFLVTTNGEYLWKTHAQNIGHAHAAADLVATALRLFSGSPYLWGGRSVRGLDCSAVVQLSAFGSGLSLPRDSGDQQQALAHDIAYHQRMRNDLLYWPGHVAILLDADTLFHATAHSMTCCTEPLQAVEERAGKPVVIKRIEQEVNI